MRTSTASERSPEGGDLCLAVGYQVHDVAEKEFWGWGLGSSVKAPA
jgi:hypothetical protein